MTEDGIFIPRLPFTPCERNLVQRLRTPIQVQRFLNSLPYNLELPPRGKTLHTLRSVVYHRTAHCMEAALVAATILEQHGYPPLLMSFESVDKLDHVMFVYRQCGQWGSVARSRDPGLHGRKPAFRTTRDLALSYVEPYVDYTGRITGYAVVDLRKIDPYDWRLSEKNVWKTERLLQDFPHRPIRSSDRRIDKLRRQYRAFKERHPNRKPVNYAGRNRWTELPKGFY